MSAKKLDVEYGKQCAIDGRMPNEDDTAETWRAYSDAVLDMYGPDSSTPTPALYDNVEEHYLEGQGKVLHSLRKRKCRLEDDFTT